MNAEPGTARRLVHVVPMEGLHLACRALLGIVLVVAGSLKVLDRQGMVLAIDAYDVLPTMLVEPLAILLPWAEVVLGLMLLAGIRIRVAAVGAAVLLVAFLVAMAQAAARGLAIDCGCFGGGGVGEGVGWWPIVRDVSLLASALYLGWRPRGPWQVDSLFVEGGRAR